jgi:HEAT repeat protein
VRAASLADASQRLLAVRALPPTPGSLEALVAAAHDPAVEVAREAVGRLVAVGGERARETLRELMWAADPVLTDDLARGLARLGDPHAVAEASVRVRSSRYGDRVAAVAVLDAYADPASAPLLREAAADEIAAVRRRALIAIRRLPGAVENWMLARDALADSDPQVRGAAVAAVAMLAPDPGRDLAHLVADANAGVRRELARVATRLSGETARRLLADEDSHVRELAAEHAGPQALEALRDALRCDRRPAVRRLAVRRLAALRDDATAVLIDALGDPDALVRAAATRSLGELYPRARLLELLAAAAGDRDRRGRPAILYALARLDAREVAPTLASLVDDEDPRVRLALVHAAEQLGAGAVVRALRADADATVRQAAQTAWSRPRQR